MTLLPEKSVEDARVLAPPRGGDTAAVVQDIVEDVRRRGEDAVRRHAERLGDVEVGGELYLTRGELRERRGDVSRDVLALLERTAERIGLFASAQRDSIREVSITQQGVRCAQELAPVDTAGCYAPGGRFPLPSSVLMTALTARVAGVPRVWVASPRPSPVTLAAAAVAGADGVLAVGGAQAIAALTFGCGPVPACDVIVGPGNRYVTAAKAYVFGEAGIDGLAGPSELVVLADGTASPALVAADLLAQAEHDPDARPILVTPDRDLLAAVRTEAERQLERLATAAIARQAMAAGAAVVVEDLGEGVAACNRLAPEHLEVHVANPRAIRHGLRHFGGAFFGAGCAEVLGDYGAGPNHVLPTAGSARFTGGLSGVSFLRIRTWMDGTPDPELLDDCAALAALEGLDGHRRAAEMRRK